MMLSQNTAIDIPVQLGSHQGLGPHVPALCEEEEELPK